MDVAIAVGESPPAWAVDQLHAVGLDLRHVDDPLETGHGDGVVAYVMNSYGAAPTPMDERLAEWFPDLRLVIYQGQSTEPNDYRSFVNLDAMRRHGVAVAHTPAGEAVAEAAFGLLIALDLDLISACEANDELPPHRGLSGSTLGILGLGQIGTHIARLAVSAGMRVRYAARRDHRDAERDLGVQRVGIEELFRTSEFLTVHLPTSTPPALVGGRLLASAHDLILINNTSIPDIVDPAGLLDALRKGAVLRAYSEGRYGGPWQDRLRDLGPGRFVSAPAYTSWNTPRARAAGWELTVAAIRALNDGEPIPHRLV